MADYEFITISWQDDVTIVHVVNPELQDRLMISELGDELIDFVERESPQKLLVSFDEVTYCSSEAIGSLIRARRRVLAGGGQMILCAMMPEVSRLFDITHLRDTLFDIYPTVADGVKAF